MKQQDLYFRLSLIWLALVSSGAAFVFFKFF